MAYFNLSVIMFYVATRMSWGVFFVIPAEFRRVDEVGIPSLCDQLPCLGIGEA
jgi:hypothetical protein